MNNKKKYFYISTPIYYPNANPHVGHVYSTLYADIIARFQREQGKEVFFVTGCDQHGKKIATAALANNQRAIEFAKKNTKKFRDLWDQMNISYTHFVETTNPNHVKFVLECFTKLYQPEKNITKSKKVEFLEYIGFYCVSCENFLPFKQDLIQKERLSRAVNPCQDCQKQICTLEHSHSSVPPLCLDCQVPTRLIEERNFRFKFSPADKELLVSLFKFYREQYPSDFHWINSIINSQFLTKYFQFWKSITRQKKKTGVDNWGIDLAQLPKEVLNQQYSDEEIQKIKNQIVYVWFEALLSYLSVLPASARKKLWEKEQGKTFPSYLTKKEDFQENIEVVQLLGKDIVKFHFLLWPVLLTNLGYRLPNRFLVHGWILNKGRKISKSKSETLVPFQVYLDKYGVNIFRLFFASLMNAKIDVYFDENDLKNFYKNRVVNDLSNYLYRLLVMIDKYRSVSDQIQLKFESNNLENDFVKQLKMYANEHKKYFETFALSLVVRNIFTFLGWANALIERDKPWILFKNNQTLLLQFFYKHFIIVKNIALFLKPITPDLSREILTMFNLSYDQSYYDFDLIWQNKKNNYLIKKLFSDK